MSEMPNRSPDPIDIAVGTQVRARRRQLGTSQQDLARALGLTFQQVQKYEKGTNRISASMLVRIAERLDIPVAALFPQGAVSANDTRTFQQFSTPGAPELLDAYASIPSARQRKAVLQLARSLARTAGLDKSNEGAVAEK